LADQPWRLSSPDAQSGRYARLWQEAGGQLAGFAAWQPPWAVLDLLVRDGPHHRVVADAIFGWADSLFRELDDERGFALPYWLECRADDRDTAALAGARGFTISEGRYACLERPLAGGPAPVRQARSGGALSRLPDGFRLRELAWHRRCSPRYPAGSRRPAPNASASRQTRPTRSPSAAMRPPASGSPIRSGH
jgi:hypothetical protein